MSQCDAAVLWIRADGAWPAGSAEAPAGGPTPTRGGQFGGGAGGGASTPSSRRSGGAGCGGCIRSSGWPGAGVAADAEAAAAEARRLARRARAEALERILRFHLRAAGLDDGLAEQVRFHPTRRWRFDFAWPAELLAVEVDGGLYVRGRHSRPGGQRGDMEKANEAILAGWRVLRVTREHLRSGEALGWIARARGRSGDFRQAPRSGGATLQTCRLPRSARAVHRAARVSRPSDGATSTEPSGTVEPTASAPARRRAATARTIGAGARRS